MEVTRSATLTRRPRWNDNPDPEGTFGDYISDHGFHCKVGELPYYGDAPGVSCERSGRYLMLWQWSPKHGCNLYHMQTNDGRVAIEMHKGNLCGDVSKGYGSDVRGCLLPGMTVALFEPGSIYKDPMKPPVQQYGVTSSGDALAALEKDMQDPKTGEQIPFWLTIC